MKRIFIYLSIATLSVAGLYAQDDTNFQKIYQQAKEQQAKDLKVYEQQQEQALQTAIISQRKYYIAEAEKTMLAKKREVQNDLESRRAQLMHRSEGMAPLRLR